MAKRFLLVALSLILVVSAVPFALADARSALAQFDRLLANDSLDACARSNCDALMQRLRGEQA